MKYEASNISAFEIFPRTSALDGAHHVLAGLHPHARQCRERLGIHPVEIRRVGLDVVRADDLGQARDVRFAHVTSPRRLRDRWTRAQRKQFHG